MVLEASALLVEPTAQLRPGAAGKRDTALPSVDAGDETTGHPRVRRRPGKAEPVRCHGRVVMKAGQAARERVDIRRAQGPRRQALAPESAVGKASHPHGEVDHRSLSLQGRALGSLADRDDIEI